MTDRERAARLGLAAALVGTTAPQDAPLSTELDAVIAAARAERLDAVLAHRVAGEESGRGWPNASRAALRHHLLQHLVLNSVRERALLPMFETLAGAQVDVLLIKGVGLAYTVYAAPHLRPRDDTDLFIRREDLERADLALRTIGYARMPEPDAELASTQRHYAWVDGAGVRHLVDLHWRIAIPRHFAEALTFEDVWSRAVPVLPLGHAVRTPGIADALLIACMHRVAHHHDRADLLWVWDIHLLVERLSEDARSRFVDLAARAGMCAVCVRGLDLAREWLGTDVDVLAEALEAARAGRDEPSARFLGGLRMVDVLRADFDALNGWRARLQLVREHLFPPAAYMRTMYGSDRWLPMTYLRRIVRGAPGWLRRPGERD